MTICAYQRECLFGEILEGVMQLNQLGQVAAGCWRKIPAHFPNVVLDEFVIMPNHLHGILMIMEQLDASRQRAKHLPPGLAANASPLHLAARPIGTSSGSLGAIMQNFKAVSTRKINALRQTTGLSVWQRNYYEHIIRKAENLDEIRQYIVNNPAQWAADKENKAWIS